MTKPIVSYYTRQFILYCVKYTDNCDTFAPTVVTTATQKEHTKQIEGLVARRGVTSVTESDMEQKTVPTRPPPQTPTPQTSDTT